MRLEKEKAEKFFAEPVLLPEVDVSFWVQRPPHRLLEKPSVFHSPTRLFPPVDSLYGWNWPSDRRRHFTSCIEIKPAPQIFLTSKAFHNAMITHAACGGSSNLIIHLAAIAFHAGFKRPTVNDWDKINRMVPRLGGCTTQRSGRAFHRSILSGRRSTRTDDPIERDRSS